MVLFECSPRYLLSYSIFSLGDLNLLDDFGFVNQFIKVYYIMSHQIKLDITMQSKAKSLTMILLLRDHFCCVLAQSHKFGLVLSHE